MGRKKIWLIDENKLEIRASKKTLQRMLSDSVDIEDMFPPYPKVGDYLALLQDPDTACFIIDQRLKDTGIANYTGIELANYIRSINTKLPLYILTNFIEDFEKFSERGLSVEDVIEKNLLSGDEKVKQVIAARILRRINIFNDILDERENRFHNLLVKSLSKKLSNKEISELNKLQEVRLSSILAEEINQLDKIEKSIKKYKELMQSLGKKV